MTNDPATLQMLLNRAHERILRLVPLIDHSARAEERAMKTLGTEYGPSQLAYAVGTLQGALERLREEIEWASEDQERDEEAYK